MVIYQHKKSVDRVSVVTDLEKLNHRNHWRTFMEKYNCQVICELGVRDGRNLALMIEHKPKKAVGIDSWIDDGVTSRNDLAFTQKELDQQYEGTKKKFTDKPFVTIYREYTFTAVNRFPGNHFELIYIDADHTYEGCLRDLTDWYPKVKKGGFLIGDDYLVKKLKKSGVRFGVISAVNEFAKKHSLTVYKLPLFGWALIKR